jgi:uncharacterized protein
MSKTLKAQELLQLTQGEQMMKMFEPMMKSMIGMANQNMSVEERTRISEVQQQMMALVVDRLNQAKPAIAKIYSDIYTEEEIDAILGFYKSPAGKAFLEKMPEVMQRSTPLLMVLMSNLQPEIMKIVQEMKQNSK